MSKQNEQKMKRVINIDKASNTVKDPLKDSGAFNHLIPKVKELMGPSIFLREDPDILMVGDRFARTYYLEALPNYVGVGYLSQLYDTDYDVDVSLKIKPRPLQEARKELQDRLTILEAQYQTAVQDGDYRNRDTMLDQIEGIKRQIEEQQRGNESAFEVQLFFVLYAESRDALERDSSILIENLKNSGIVFHSGALRQDKFYKSVIPYGIDYVDDKKRNFNTGAVLSSVPFYIPELYDSKGVYIGRNSYGLKPAQIDLYKEGIPNSNMNLFGASGSGKSTFMKLLTMRSAVEGIRTLIIDPEGEYGTLTKNLGGAYIKLTNNPRMSKMINIFDVEEDEVLVDNRIEKTLDLDSKYEDIVGFVEVIYPEITPRQKSSLLEVIEFLYVDRGIYNGDPSSLYEHDDVFVEDGQLKNANYKKIMPKLSDLVYEIDLNIKNGDRPELQPVFDTLQPYLSHKSRGVFDTYTPKELEDLGSFPIICMDISEIEQGDLRNTAMYVLLSWAWEKFGKKYPEIKKRIVVDEAWMMLDAGFKGSQYTASFLENMSRRIRKRNGALAISTQKIQDFSASKVGSTIISNAHTTFLLSHEIEGKKVIMNEFELDESVVDRVINAQRGQCLIKQGSQVYQVNTIPYDEEMKLMTIDNYKIGGVRQ